jgi:hypothetical protein
MQGKPDQHVIRITRSVHVWSQTIYILRGQHIATFHVVVNRFKQIHCSWEEWLPTQPTARRPTSPRVHTQLLSRDNQRSSREKLSFCWQSATSFTGLISPICNRYVQYLLAGTNTLVLNRHRRGIQPPKGHARSPAIQSPHKPQVKCDMKHLSPIRGLSTTQHLPKSISTPSND